MPELIILRLDTLLIVIIRSLIYYLGMGCLSLSGPENTR